MRPVFTGLFLFSKVVYIRSETFLMKQLQQLLLFSVLILLLFSCTEAGKTDVNRAINVFFLGLFQVLNIILFGVSSFILCLLGMTNNKKNLKIIGGALLGMFTLFALLGLMAVLNQRPKNGTIYVLFLFEFFILGANVVFLSLKPKASASTGMHSGTTHRIESDDQNDLIDF